MLLRRELEELTTRGYLIVPEYLDREECHSIYDWIDKARSKHHTEDNVRDRISYPSDESGTRVSNAYMVSTGRSRLPNIRMGIQENHYLMDIIDDFQMFLAQANSVTLEEVIDTRCMLNVQRYESGSKPVPIHFDGEYFETFGDTTRLIEGIIPQYVGVYTLFNEGINGTELYDIEHDLDIPIECQEGDLVLFDNLRFLHSVEELEQPRSIFGLRNFDFNPYHYNQEAGEKIYHKCFAGFRTQISTAEAEEKHRDFISKWKQSYVEGADKAKF